MTYNQAVAILRTRLGGLMDEAELTNDHYESCISWAVRQCGGTTASADQVTEAEVGAITDVDKLLDFAELCLIKDIIGNLVRVDWKAGPISEKHSQLTGYATKLKENKEKQMKADYGYGASSVTVGYIDLNMSEVG